jgi:hypothetical protein
MKKATPLLRQAKIGFGGQARVAPA